MSSYDEIKVQTADVLGIRVVKRTNTGKAHAAVRDVIIANPTLTYLQIAQLLKCSHWLVYTTAAKYGIRRPRGAGSPARRKRSGESKNG